MRLADIDYELPPPAIAQTPAEPRDSARLLAVGPDLELAHHTVADLPRLLAPGDLVVVNETKVRRARIVGTRAGGGRAEALLLRPADGQTGAASDGWWEALVRPSRKLPAGSAISVAGERALEVGDHLEGGRRLVRPAAGTEQLDGMDTLMARVGAVPLPPYIRHPLADPDRYQTVFARATGSAAAPTAGLHMTEGVRRGLAARGIGWATIDLHVGADTFRPVTADDPRNHEIHRERYSVPAATWSDVDETRRRQARVVAVGTTTARALETVAAGGPLDGDSTLFITPGHRFDAVDVLMTNFHAPRSTLLLLLEAVMGPAWRDVYAAALGQGYRFLSFGDAMLVHVRSA